MLSLIDIIVSFISFVFATIFCCTYTISDSLVSQILKLGLLYSFVTFLCIHSFNLKPKIEIQTKDILKHTSIFLLSIIITAFLSYAQWLSVQISTMTVLLNIMLWTITHCAMHKANPISKPKVIIIGTKALIESMVHHHSIQTVGAICFDDKSQCIGGYIPNLGTLDDLPALLKRLQNIPNLTFIAEEYVANKIKNIISCPVLAVDEESLEIYETA